MKKKRNFSLTALFFLTSCVYTPMERFYVLSNTEYNINRSSLTITLIETKKYNYIGNIVVDPEFIFLHKQYDEDYVKEHPICSDFEITYYPNNSFLIKSLVAPFLIMERMGDEDNPIYKIIAHNNGSIQIQKVVLILVAANIAVLQKILII